MNEFPECAWGGEIAKAYGTQALTRNCLLRGRPAWQWLPIVECQICPVPKLERVVRAGDQYMRDIRDELPDAEGDFVLALGDALDSLPPGSGEEAAPEAEAMTAGVKELGPPQQKEEHDG